MSAVDGDERLRELARMMAGTPDSEIAVEHARELLEQARARPRDAERRRCPRDGRVACRGAGCPTRGTMVGDALSLRRPRREPDLPGVHGTVRVDARTKDLTKRLRPGDIAVIDHQDIDKVSAEALLACRPAAVVNAAPSISGRYPNLGPEILVDGRHPADRQRRARTSCSSCARGSRSGSTATAIYVGDDVVATGTALRRRGGRRRR